MLQNRVVSQWCLFRDCVDCVCSLDWCGCFSVCRPVSCAVFTGNVTLPPAGSRWFQRVRGWQMPTCRSSRAASLEPPYWPCSGTAHIDRNHYNLPPLMKWLRTFTNTYWDISIYYHFNFWSITFLPYICFCTCICFLILRIYADYMVNQSRSSFLNQFIYEIKNAIIMKSYNFWSDN